MRVKELDGRKVPCPYKGASLLDADIEFDGGFDFEVHDPENAFLTVEVWVHHPPTLRALLASRMFPVADLIDGQTDLGFVTFAADRANLSADAPPLVDMSVAWRPETFPALEYGGASPPDQTRTHSDSAGVSPTPSVASEGLAQLAYVPNHILSAAKRDAAASIADFEGQLTPRRLSLDNDQHRTLVH